MRLGFRGELVSCSLQESELWMMGHNDFNEAWVGLRMWPKRCSRKLSYASIYANKIK